MAHKCNLCFDRLDHGFEPFCALCCGVEAIYWGDMEDPESRVSQVISKRNAYALKPGPDPASAIARRESREKVETMTIRYVTPHRR